MKLFHLSERYLCHLSRQKDPALIVERLGLSELINKRCRICQCLFASVSYVLTIVVTHNDQ